MKNNCYIMFSYIIKCLQTAVKHVKKTFKRISSLPGQFNHINTIVSKYIKLVMNTFKYLTLPK